MTATPYTLVIGTKNWSSWSLRPWLLMTMAGIPFHEVEIALRSPTTPEAIRAHAPAGLVPVLKCADGFAVWDSLAIAEFLAERHPDRGLWPADPRARARARSVSAEMHAGFRALRLELPMDCMARTPLTPSEEARRDIDRITALWREARAGFGADGPFLFGRFSIADAMYAPVVSRFVTYDVALGEVEAQYRETIWTLPAMKAWLGACAAWADPAPPAS